MIKKLFILAIILLSGMQTATANSHKNDPNTTVQPNKDSARIVELDYFWAELARTVREGDFESYKAAYHEDAVVVFASGKNKVSVSIAEALASWKQGFIDTKTGKKQDNVEFRFSQRIGNETTAHETGIFIFTSADSKGKILAKYITHFEMLLVKRNNTWYALMEYQRSDGTEEQWEALKE